MKQIILYGKAIIITVALNLFLSPVLVFAQPANTAPEPTIIPFNQPVKGDVNTIIQRIINGLFALIATVSIIFIVIGGFRLVFSQGSDEAVKKTKATITGALIGLVVAILAFYVDTRCNRLITTLRKDQPGIHQ